MRRFFCLALAVCLFACGSRERGPSLVEVKELGPRHLEVGDRVRLRGSGFPEGRPVAVTLRGEVRRAGDKPRDNVTLTTPAELVAPHALEFRVTPELAAKVCGAPDARHATFRGDVEVAFSPQRASGVSVTGRLEGVVLDVAPDAAHEPAEALAADGRRFAAFSGVVLTPRADGLVVSELVPKSRGSRAGLAQGDLIVELDGVITRSFADFIPPPNARTSLLSVRRGAELVTLQLDSSGFSYSAPETLLPALIVLGAVLGAALVWTSWFGRAFGMLERRLRDRARARSGATPGTQSSRARALLRALSEALPHSFLPYLLLLAQSALVGLLALGVGLVAIELDLLVIPAASLSALLACAVLSGGDHRGRSLRTGLRRAGVLLLLNIPFLALLLSALVWAGSLRPSDVVALQGAWPWQWAALRNPALGVLALLSVAGLVPTPLESKVLAAPTAPRAPRALEHVWWLHALIVTAFVEIVAFGGFHSPFSAGEGSRVLAALLALGKSWVLVGVVVGLRWLIGPLAALSLRRVILLGLVIPSAFSLIIQAAVSLFASGPVLGTLAAALCPIACGVAIGVTALAAHRVISALHVPVEAGVQPWL